MNLSNILTLFVLIDFELIKDGVAWALGEDGFTLPWLLKYFFSNLFWLSAGKPKPRYPASKANAAVLRAAFKPFASKTSLFSLFEKKSIRRFSASLFKLLSVNPWRPFCFNSTILIFFGF